jgi:hypothetical protein
MSDPIIAEIRIIRERIAEESGGDIHAIAAAARRRQLLSGVKTVSRSKRTPGPNVAKALPLDSKSLGTGPDTKMPNVGS